MKNAKQRWYGGLLGFIGFMLSPLSWWNDAFVNLPLALAFGWLVAAIYKPAFQPAVVFGYWLTNVLGFVLLHKGTQKVIQGESQPYSRATLLRDLAISLLYTAMIVAGLKLKLFQPFQDYLRK